MANFCSQCGAQIAPDSRFCSACGAPVSANGGAQSGEPVVPLVQDSAISAVPSSVPVPAAPASAPVPASNEPLDEAAFYDMSTDEFDKTHKSYLNLILGIIGLIVIGGTAVLAYNAFSGGKGLTEVGTGNGMADGNQSAPAAQPEGQRVTLYVMTEANVRDKPTASGSNVISKLARGEELNGTVITGLDGTSQWLKLDGSDQYIGMVNLDPAPRVPLKSTDGSDLSTAGQCVFLANPVAGGAVKVTLPAGQPIKRIGVTQDGFAEYGLPKGGVGYIADGGAACKTTGAKTAGAVSNSLIQLSADSCDFGPEMEAYFDAAATKARANGGDIEEGTTVTVPVNKVFHGVKVNSAFIGYEWHGVYFAAPASQVRQLFRDMGVQVGQDGHIASQDLAVGIYDTEGGDRKQGQSFLTCGV